MNCFKNRRMRRCGFSLLCLLLSAVTLFLLLDARVRPIVRRLTAVQAQSLAADAMGQGVAAALSLCKTEYADLVSLQRDEDGRIVSVQTDAFSVNRVKTLVNQSVTQALTDLAEKPLGVPLGSLTGLALLNGRGAKLPVLINVTGSAQTVFENRFESAGANQTRHQIFMTTTLTVLTV
ncbi:MAG TPA: hypothetical protein DDY98_08795, partial [Ruminococcaceae bacterium]|nr:hypothetical protein [Oscillospiraceae bacterium]